MPTVTGKIEDILVEPKNIQGEMKDIHYVVVGGKKYKAGFYPANYGGRTKPAQVGDDVVFEYEYKWKENQVDYKTFRKTGAAVAESVQKSAPVDNNLRIRMAALEAAVKVPIDLPTSDGYIDLAKKFEAYLAGE